MSLTRKSSRQRPSSLGPKGSPLAELGGRLTVTEQRTRTISEFGSRPVTPAIVETRTVIHKEEWLEAARRGTEHFKQHGSPLPLVWVLTKGNEIPDNAVPFGEDRDGFTTYIARGVLEGGLHIGKASTQHSGAVIRYAGKEHTVANYEVLVCASQLRWGFPPAVSEGVPARGTVVLAQQQQRGQKQSSRSRSCEIEVDSLNVTLVESDIPRYVPDEVEVVTDREASLKRLAEVKTVIVIDDSMSMQEGSLWEQAREALAGIVDIANQYGSKGCDIHFMHEDDYAPSILSGEEVIALFDRILPEGACEDTPTGAKLGQVINHYLPLIEQERSAHEPITVLVVTDGLPTDQEDLERVIVDAAHRLDRHRVKHDMFGIQFVQIGTDPAASELLHKLDDHLVTRYQIRDLVDSTPYDPAQGAFDTEYMLKILLGGIHKDLDRAGSTVGSTLLSPLRPYENSSRNLSTRLGNNSTRLATVSTVSVGY